MTRTVGFFLVPGFEAIDLMGPFSAFETALALDDSTRYALQPCSVAGGSVTSSSGSVVPTVPIADLTLDTLVVVGGSGPRLAADDSVAVTAVANGAASARRLTSVCTGAFLLAAAGLLEGRRATTHWRHADELRRRFPSIRLEADRVFVRDGPVWSCAGFLAGVDLALALIGQDHDEALASAVADELVLYHRRSGGQPQLGAMQALRPESERVRAALEFARAHLDESLSVERLAEAACLGRRQFSRVFRAETGESPARAIERLRVEEAKVLVEDGRRPLERIATAVGFGDPERMRRAFVRVLGQAPRTLRGREQHAPVDEPNMTG